MQTYNRINCKWTKNLKIKLNTYKYQKKIWKAFIYNLGEEKVYKAKSRSNTTIKVDYTKIKNFT